VCAFSELCRAVRRAQFELRLVGRRKVVRATLNRNLPYSTVKNVWASRQTDRRAHPPHTRDVYYYDGPRQPWTPREHVNESNRTAKVATPAFCPAWKRPMFDEDRNVSGSGTSNALHDTHLAGEVERRVETINAGGSLKHLHHRLLAIHLQHLRKYRVRNPDQESRRSYGFQTDTPMPPPC